LEENVQKYNKLNGCIRRYIGKNMRKELQLQLHKIISKPSLNYGSETWVLTAEDTRRMEAAQMRFLGSIFGVTLRDKIKSQAIARRKHSSRN
jgi:hypothetical protein